jgi:hypothetical protein
MPILTFWRFAGPRNTAPYVLAEQIAAKGVRWRAKASNPSLYEPGDRFWQGRPPAVDFMDCSATKFTEWGGLAGPVTLYGIEVAREDIEAAEVGEPLSAPATAGTEVQSASPSAEPAATEPPPLRGLKRWVFAQCDRNPPPKRDRNYTGEFLERCPFRGVKPKTIQNYVSLWRKEPRQKAQRN